MDIPLTHYSSSLLSLSLLLLDLNEESSMMMIHHSMKDVSWVIVRVLHWLTVLMFLSFDWLNVHWVSRSSPLHEEEGFRSRMMLPLRYLFSILLPIVGDEFVKDLLLLDFEKENEVREERMVVG